MIAQKESPCAEIFPFAIFSTISNYVPVFYYYSFIYDIISLYMDIQKCRYIPIKRLIRN